MELALMIILFIVMIITLYKLLLVILFTRKKNKHTGIIVDVKKNLEQGRIRYSYIISIGGEKVIEKEVMSMPIYKNGEEVTIFYKCDNSNKVIFRDFDDHWSLILKYAFSFVFLLFGCFEVYNILLFPSEFSIPHMSKQVSFFALFLVFLFLSFRLFNKAALLKKNSVRTIGIVTGFEKERDIDNIHKYRPVVEYKDFKGEIHTFCSSKMLDDPSNVGDEVRIVYNKNSVNNVELDSFFVLWGLPIFCAVFAIVSFIILISIN